MAIMYVRRISGMVFTLVYNSLWWTYILRTKRLHVYDYIRHPYTISKLDPCIHSNTPLAYKLVHSDNTPRFLGLSFIGFELREELIRREGRARADKFSLLVSSMGTNWCDVVALLR